MTQTATRPQHVADLRRLGACPDAVEFAAQHDSLQTAWGACERGDWMLWLLGILSGPAGSEARRPLVLAACACARLALKHAKAGEDRPRLAIEAAERWARGDVGVTLDDVHAAANAAYAAAIAAYAAAANAAIAAYAAATAATAASAASANAAATVWRSERGKTLRACADLVRECCPSAPVIVHH